MSVRGGVRVDKEFQGYTSIVGDVAFKVELGWIWRGSVSAVGEFPRDGRNTDQKRRDYPLICGGRRMLGQDLLWKPWWVVVYEIVGMGV